MFKKIKLMDLLVTAWNDVGAATALAETKKCHDD